MYNKITSAAFLLVAVISFSTLSAQDLYIKTGSNMYLGTDAVISALGNVVSEEDITGATNGRMLLVGDNNTTLDMSNKSIHGLDIAKNATKTVTLTDSLFAKNLYLHTGNLLLNNYCVNITNNLDNFRSSTKLGVIKAPGSMKFNYANANSDTLYLDKSSNGITNQLVDFYINGKANILLGDSVNIYRLAYIGKDATLKAHATKSYIRMVATDSNIYGQLQFENGAKVTGKGTSEMMNFHEASYIHIGTPYTGGDYSQLSDDVSVYFGSVGTSNQWNLFTYDESRAAKSTKLKSFWDVVDAETDNFTRGKGHALYTWGLSAGAALPTAYPNTIDVSGDFTTANFVQTASYTTSPFSYNADSTGWHIVSNPFYCNINVPTLPTGILGQTFYKYKSDANGNYQYIGFNTSTNTAVNGGTRYVAPMQTLYYQAASGGATVTFDPSWQESTPTNNTNNWKSAIVTDQIRLTAQSNANKNTDEAIIGFMGTAQNGFANEDARKVNNGYTYPNIFTYAAENRLAFNYMNTVNDETTIPVGFSAATSGSYNITATNEEQDKVNTIILEDKDKKTFTDLTFGGNYTFDHDASNKAERFVLHLKKSTSSVQDVTGNNSFFVYIADNNIAINFKSANENVSVHIYDMLGREMTTGFEGKNATEKLDFSTSGWAPAYYLVNIKTATETNTIKVLVK